MAKPRLGSKSLHLLEKLNTLDEPVGGSQISGKVMTPETALQTLRRLERRGFVKRGSYQNPRHLAWNYYTLWAITEAGREALCAHFAPNRVVGM